jgi:hypothetical protein
MSLAAPVPLMDGTNGVPPFLVFPYQIGNKYRSQNELTTLAPKYAGCWGMQELASVPISAWWPKSTNPNFWNMWYMFYTMDNGVVGNYGQTGNLAWWQANHPTWVVYSDAGTTPANYYGLSNVVLDKTNAAVIAFQAQQASGLVTLYQTANPTLPASSIPFDALACDNVSWDNGQGTGAGQYEKYINGSNVYSGSAHDAAYKGAVNSWLSSFTAAVHAIAPGLKVIPNFTPGSWGYNDSQIEGSIVAVCDGILDEQGFSGAGGGLLTGANWLYKLQFVQLMQKYGKPLFMINTNITGDPVSGKRYLLASYLMGKYSLCYLFLSKYNGGNHTYGDLPDLDFTAEYGANVGSPLGVVVNDVIQAVYHRVYSNGYVVINTDASNNYSVQVPPGRYKDIYGNIVFGGPYQLNSKDALILVNY